MVESSTSIKHPDKQTTDSADTAAQASSIPRWVVIVAALVVLLPVLLMASIMLMMSSFGPSMHGGIAAAGPGLFPVVGVIPLVLVLAIIYVVFRPHAADTQ